MITYPLHPEANEIFERWNCTLAKDLAGFVATGEVDWDEHAALACFHCNTTVCFLTGMTPYKATIVSRHLKHRVKWIYRYAMRNQEI